MSSLFHFVSVCFVFFADQDEFDLTQTYENYAKQGDPWNNNLSSLRNHVRALHSLHELSVAVENNGFTSKTVKSVKNGNSNFNSNSNINSRYNEMKRTKEQILSDANEKQEYNIASENENDSENESENNFRKFYSDEEKRFLRKRKTLDNNDHNENKKNYNYDTNNINSNSNFEDKIIRNSNRGKINNNNNNNRNIKIKIFHHMMQLYLFDLMSSFYLIFPSNYYHFFRTHYLYLIFTDLVEVRYLDITFKLSLFELVFHIKMSQYLIHDEFSFLEMILITIKRFLM